MGTTPICTGTILSTLSRVALVQNDIVHSHDDIEDATHQGGADDAGTDHGQQSQHQMVYGVKQEDHGGWYQK